MRYGWPGNVRELQNAVERALILCKGNTLAFDNLEGTQNAVPAMPSSGHEEELGLDEFVSRRIMMTPRRTNGRVGGESGAAKLLKLNPATHRSKMRKLGIPFGRTKFT